MQLFTIGLNRLRIDGTVVKNDEGAAIPTYTNQHVETFARVWTGFKYQAVRGNLEADSANIIDPMLMQVTQSSP